MAMCSCPPDHDHDWRGEQRADGQPGECDLCECVISPAEAQQRWTEAVSKLQPRQLAMARLMELTPELRAHYACDPSLECGHPECQP